MSIDIRQVAAEDIDSIANLSEEGFGQFYQFDWQANAVALYEAVVAGRAFVAVAEAGDEIVGYCNLRTWPVGGWVDQVVVSGGMRRQGVGRALIEAVVREAVRRKFWKVSLITSEGDAGTRLFFERCGWEVVGVMKDEIKRGVNGILMSRILDYRLHPNS